jgi:hypothetical protein
MTIRPETDFGRRGETDVATITAAGNFILFHASHRKLGMFDRNRDNLLMGDLLNMRGKSSLTISTKPDGIQAVSHTDSEGEIFSLLSRNAMEALRCACA